LKGPKHLEASAIDYYFSEIRKMVVARFLSCQVSLHCNQSFLNSNMGLK